MSRHSTFIDVRKLKPLKKIAVDINGKPADLRIGDKLRWPEDSPIIKTVVSMTIFEDGTVNYQLKWFDGCDFKSELVSLSDLKLLNVNSMPPQQIQLNQEDLQKILSDKFVPIET